MTTARDEWAAMWPLPLVSMLGYVGGASFAYSSGVFMEELTGEFGWSRAEFSSAFTIYSVVGLCMAPVIGRLVDRVGPGKVALIGIVPFMIGLSLFGLANGPIVAGAFRDRWGSYQPYFLAMIPVALIAATLIGSIPLQERATGDAVA